MARQPAPQNTTTAIAVWKPPTVPAAELRTCWPQARVDDWLKRIQVGQTIESAGIAAGLRPRDLQRVLKALADVTPTEDKQLNRIVRAVRIARAQAETIMFQTMMGQPDDQGHYEPRDPKAPAWILERSFGYEKKSEASKAPILQVQVGIKVG